VFRIRDVLSRIRPFSHPGSLVQSGMQTYFFLASYAFRSKGLVLVPGNTGSQKDPRSGKQIKFISDPDPRSRELKSTGSGSAALVPILFFRSCSLLLISGFFWLPHQHHMHLLCPNPCSRKPRGNPRFPSRQVLG
jgi:hypothetical protein